MCAPQQETAKKGDNNLDPRQEAIIRQRIIFSEMKENKERQKKMGPALNGHIHNINRAFNCYNFRLLS